MTVTPVPVLALNSIDVASGPNPDGTLPSLLALDGASVRWGRAAVLDQPTPATATVSLFDPSGTWAAGVDLIGQPVTLRWTVPGTSHVYFRGRVTDVAVRPVSAAGRDGATVDLSCSSVLVDLANRRPAAGAWPAETVAARRTRLAALAAGPVAAVGSRAAFDAAPLAAVPNPESSTVLDQLVGLFTSTGADRYSYDPDTQTVDWLGRRTFPAATVAHLVSDSTRVGVYVTGPAVQRDVSQPTYPAVTLDAGVVSGDRTAAKTMDSRLTHVQLTYLSPTDGSTIGMTYLVPGVDAAVVGARAVDVKTTLTDTTYALSAGQDAAALVAGEASGWALPPMRWDTARTGGGFDTIAQAKLLLDGVERAGVFWLAGSWLTALGIMPCFGVMGGLIAYRRGSWDVEWNPAPTQATGTATGIAWEALDASLVWDDDDTNPHRMHDSVTYDDLRFVASGAITIGA